MVCFFCIATIALVAGAMGTGTIEAIRAGLEQLSRDGVKVTDDTASTQRLELAVEVPEAARSRTAPVPAAERAVPVAVTLYKKHGRVRVQVLTHDVTRAQAEAVQDTVLKAAGLTLVHRSDEHEQHVVHDAVERLAHEHGDPLAATQVTEERER